MLCKDRKKYIYVPKLSNFTSNTDKKKQDLSANFCNFKLILNLVNKLII